ncbi:TPA: hypothetical protein QH056_001841 [Klebsiella oxytoca]|nr:hypothetical protein [Klebsiella oxytoca]
MAGNKRPEGKTSLQVWIDEDQHKKFKLICTMRETKMTTVVEMMIDQYIDEQMNQLTYLEKAIRDSKK